MAQQFSLFGGLLNPDLEPVFRKLAVPVESNEVEPLKEEIIGYLGKVKQAQKKNEFLNGTLAGKIGETSILLLESYNTYSKEHQTLMIGAVKYFLLSGDQDKDISSPLGFDDDAEVLNFVLKSIGRDELLIDIEGEF